MEKKFDESREEKREEVLLSWSSPSRLFKRRDREFYTNIGAIVFLIIVILMFAKEYVFIFAVLSVVFLVYVLSTVEPEDVHHQITNLGIESAGHFYRWESLHEFWLEEQWGKTLLVLRPYFGARTVVLIGDQDKGEIRTLIAKYIPYREQPEKTWVDKAARWLSEKIPLEKQAS